MSRAQNADVGAAGEQRASEWRPELALVDDAADHRVDGHLTEDVVAEIGAVETVVAPARTPVEVKTVALRKRDGSYSRRGELHIRAANHAALLDGNGEYIVVIYEGDRADPDALDWVRTVMIPARTVDAHITAWCEDRQYGLEIARVPWPRLLDIEQTEALADDDELVGPATETDEVVA
ncbi:hypothetical protein C2R22_24435 (plasmid) [Salinigranum rubrum]|uniref:PD(D/E)XK endonuclease domain-containing protein n=1 Tax=Salinigranum rubrum TaxID=755307 RepID=A0A2I8VRY0_9EURY|nr:hypothetical protein [Salinigranum rubrum]AUV84681.1 hypothetical protein C2R22_24435 [Salinigranum rubrum]